MSRPDQSGADPHQASAGGQRPEGASGKPWDWAIDPPPPTGPAQEPTPDPLAGPSVDAPAGPPVTPPDWSTPATPVSKPPLSGQPPTATHPAHPGGYPGTGSSPGPPGGPAPSRPLPEFARPTDRRLLFILGIVAALLSGCCVASVVVILLWGPKLYDDLRDRGQRAIGLNQPVQDGDPGFPARQLRCGRDEVGDHPDRAASTGRAGRRGLPTLLASDIEHSRRLPTLLASATERSRRLPGAPALEQVGLLGLGETDLVARSAGG